MGGEQFPGKPLTPDFDSDLFLRSYMTLLYAFDLTPDMTEGGHVDLIKHGTIRMEIHFKEALAQTVNVIVYAEYDNLIQIDRARNVITDF